MPVLGKSINLFLLDGDPNGIIKASISNWTGVGYKIPRTALDSVAERTHLNHNGIYFLIGKNIKNEPVVYVGQASQRKTGKGLYQRLTEHKTNSSKNYFTEIILFTTSSDSLGPTELCFLENYFYNKIKEVNRYKLDNSIAPTEPNISEEKQCEMLEFSSFVTLIIGVLGHKFLTPLQDSASSIVTKDRHLYLKRTLKDHGLVTAQGVQTSEGFVVLKGAKISPESDRNVPSTLRAIRNNARVDENQILLEDMLFNSPSYAAMFVIGKPANGREEWKNKDGLSLNKLEMQAVEDLTDN